MPKQLPKRSKSHLDKCRASAIAAVEVYNRPGATFRTPLYVVLIVMAWQGFFHAHFFKHGRKPWYETNTSGKGSGVRYVKVDGEPKHWSLKTCVAEYFGESNPPVRKNLEFLVGLRNKIEHRDLPPELDATLYGECQAALMNLEDSLISEFGEAHGLGESLPLSLQFSRIKPREQHQALEKLAASARNVLEYIHNFRTGLSEQILNDIGYSYRVFLVPKVANRANSADTAVEFVHLDQMDEEKRENVNKLTVLIKDRHQPVVNLDRKKPSQVVDAVSKKIPYVFKVHHHTALWKKLGVRPETRSNNPEHTQQQYCVYDSVHKDYLYSKEWTSMLIDELSDKDKFQQLTGRPPEEK